MNMNKKFKHFCFGSMLLSMIVASVSPMSAAAESDSDFTIDVEHECSMTVDYENEDEHIEGAEFEVYRVAEVDSNGNYTVEPEFAGSGVLIDSQARMDFSGCASTLETYILEEENEGEPIEPIAEGVTDEGGLISFENLDTGLYLLIGEEFTVDDDTFIPLAALVPLPVMEADEGLTYNALVYPKHKIESANVPNDDAVSVSVKKVWEDEGYESERPESVDVVLFCDGEEFDIVTLDEENNWQYEWQNLSEAHRWQLTEENVPEGYTMTSVENNYEFTVTNTIQTTDTSEPDDSSEPDSSVPDSSVPDTSSVPDSSSTPVTTSTPGTTSTPKTTTSTPKTSTPETSTPAPNTGQAWWTVSLLSLAGLVLIVLGRSLSNKTDKR
jgi:hypothetical protein